MLLSVSRQQASRAVGAGPESYRQTGGLPEW